MKYTIGVDIGATNIRVGLATENGNIINKITERTKRTEDGWVITKQIINLIDRVTKGIKSEEVVGIGIGSIGPLDLEKGEIIKPSNLPVDKVPLVRPLSERFNKKVRLLNDCTTAVVGEKVYGAGRGLKNLVYITISTGIGGGVYVDDHLLIGKDGNAAEIGHFTIDMDGRLKCGCGSRGHWEAYASGTGIPKYVKYLYENELVNGFKKSLIWKKINGDLSKLTAKIVYDSAKEGDEVALKIVDKIGMINAIGVANVINAYDPSLITLGGSVVLNNEELVLNPIKKYVSNYTINRVPDIIVTPLKDEIVLYGAIALAFNLD